MQPKLLKAKVTPYAPARFMGQNESGIKPVGEKVLVITDQCAEKTEGGVFIDPVSAERMTMAATVGIVVEVGEDAFSILPVSRRPWIGQKPKAGDRVYIERYAGQVELGDDNQIYRLMDYTCIGALRIEQPPQRITKISKPTLVHAPFLDPSGVPIV